jgi:hypothetical protein
MKTKTLLLIWCLSISCNVLAISSAAQKKYPYVLISDDYGILNENDLAHYACDKPPRPFSSEEDSGAYHYWQCFPRNKVSVTLEDMGYFSEDLGSKDTYSELKIRIYIKPTIIHEYQMRRAYPVTDYQKKFMLWHKLMTKQNYVCFAGSFSRKEKHLEAELEREISFWIFEKIKTKNGSDCYLGI